PSEGGGRPPSIPPWQGGKQDRPGDALSSGPSPSQGGVGRPPSIPPWQGGKQDRPGDALSSGPSPSQGGVGRPPPIPPWQGGKQDRPGEALSSGSPPYQGGVGGGSGTHDANLSGQTPRTSRVDRTAWKAPALAALVLAPALLLAAGCGHAKRAET